MPLKTVMKASKSDRVKDNYNMSLFRNEADYMENFQNTSS